MTAVAVAAEMQVIARAVIRREASRSGVTLPVGRGIAARRLKIPPGTLENLARGRSKTARVEHVQIILGAEIAALEARVSELRAMAAHPLSPDFQRAFAALAEARKHLGMDP